MFLVRSRSSQYHLLDLNFTVFTYLLDHGLVQERVFRIIFIIKYTSKI